MPASNDIREAQDIYISATKLDNELRELCKTRSPFDLEPTQLRARIRNELVELLIRYLDYSVEKDIEQLLWKTVHHRVIEDFRKRLRSTTTTPTTTHAEGQNPDPSSPSSINNALRKDSKILLNASFRQFLIESVGFYIHFLRQMRIEYDLDIVEKIVFQRLGTEPFGSTDSYSLFENGGVARHSISIRTKDEARFVCHRFLLSLGDLARYKEFYAERKEKNYSTAKLFYRLASQLAPDSGNPHNQLAVVESHENQQLGAVERYLRSLLIRHPFMAAKDNLFILLQKHETRVKAPISLMTSFGLLSRLFSSPEQVYEPNEMERAKQMVLNGFKNIFTKKQVNHASDMMQMFMITIGCLEIATGRSTTSRKPTAHPSMIAPTEQLLSELIITICNTTAYRLGTVGSSHNALTSTAVAPPIMQNEPLKQVSKFLSSIKLVVKWLRTRYINGHGSIEFLSGNAWKALGDALNALSAIASTSHDDSAALVHDVVLVEDVDLATFTPVTPTQPVANKVVAAKEEDEVDGNEHNRDCDGADRTAELSDHESYFDPAKLMLRLICGDRRSEEEQSIIRVYQIVQSARELCEALDSHLFHATRISPDGIEYDYFAVNKIPANMAADSPTRVSLAREIQISPLSRPDVLMRSPRRGDEDSEDLVDDTELFAPRRFNPTAAIGSNIQKRHISPSHTPYLQQPNPPPIRSSMPTSLPPPVANMVSSALNSAAQVTRNQVGLNRSGYHHNEEYDDLSIPPRFARSRIGPMGVVGDQHDHTQSTMRFLELEGGAGSGAYGSTRNIPTGMRSQVKNSSVDGTMGVDAGRYADVSSQRYDYGANFFGNGAAGVGGNNNRLPPGLTGNELSWTTFATQQARPRELSVVCDVSCDTTIPNNPLPIYADTTTFGEPVLHLKTKGEAPLDVIAIDHLPALLPREASLVTCCQVEEMKSSQ
ncbi:hypothetical protein SeLEV6574_g02979 [Synchytrium endobioticum]|uniref:Telomerase activating protein Est1-like N-terminal domain-containing protein n=1 Tax=Synchytrium endobioticum TaxID=286115 RepID=A0A507D5Y7_9FUNG|nr:hypothetical protein SeLEV6574_g02979 [Synchytrium endobioticum]